MLVAFLTLLLLAALGTLAAPAPPTPVLAPRYYASGSYYCYYKCPPTAKNGDPLQSSSKSTGGTLTCYYSPAPDSPAERVGYCSYDGRGGYTAVGGYYGGRNDQCQVFAASGDCLPSTSPPPDNQVKRSLGRQLLTPAEQSIAARQYKPRRVKPVEAAV